MTAIAAVSGLAGTLPASSESLTLRQLASTRGILVGTDFYENYAQYWQQMYSVLGNEFNLLLLDTTWWRGDQVAQYGFRNFRPGPHDFDFTFLDASVQFAQQHNMQIRGSLIWSQYLPPWLTGGGLSSAEVQTALVEHIQTVIGRYKGVVDEWIAVNEFFPPVSGGTSSDFWYNGLGEPYVDLAFKTARQADPAAKLILNNFMNEQPSPPADQDAAIVSRLKDEGLVDAYGFEMHLKGASHPDTGLFQQELQRFQGLGVETLITELDVDIRGMTGTQSDIFGKQATIFGDVLTAYFATGGRSVTFFGINDTLSWLGDDADATLFDKQSQPKPAYTAASQAIAAVPEIPRNHKLFVGGLARD